MLAQMHQQRFSFQSFSTGTPFEILHSRCGSQRPTPQDRVRCGDINIGHVRAFARHWPVPGLDVIVHGPRSSSKGVETAELP